MAELNSEQAQTSAILQVVSRLCWEREGYQTLELQRARLLDRLAGLLEQVSIDSKTQFLLGGQTVLLEDLAALRPDLLPLLVIYNASGRLAIGPWHVEVDEVLVSGESLIRNLLAARADAKKHGVNLMPIGYAPDTSGHVAQLPQILRGFGIDAAFVGLGTPVLYVPLRWEAPDGSSVLLVNHAGIPQADVPAVQASLKSQQVVEPQGPFFWLDDYDQRGADFPKMLGEGLDVPVTQSTLAAYIKTLRQTFPDNMRPAVKGELRLQGLREHSYLLPGTLSSRLYLKQAHAAMQARLTYAAEPLLAIALTHGKIIYPDNLRALLDHSWRTLLKNQAKSALGGAGSDAVHAENEVRYRQIEDSSTAVINGALRALPGELHMGNPPPATSVNETYVVLWNPHSWAITQFVEVRLDLPAGMSPNRLISPKGEEQIFGWSPDNQTISFLGEAPSVGYATYTVQLADRPPDELHLAKITLGNIIAKVSGDTLRVEDQQLVWHRDGQVLSDLLNFYDGGDAGDAYNYSPPSPNVIVQAQLEGDVKVEKAALYERMILRHRMRLATGLRADRGRERGLKLLELTTTATLYDAVPGIHFHTTFENTASDHRLRAHLRTGIAADMVLADSAFGIVARKVSIEGHEIETRPNREAVLSTYPMHNSCAVESGEGNSRAMALLARGLPEFQAIPEGSQTTLALTLLRAVGWLSRGDLKTRTASLAPMIATPGAQCERRMSADYALVALPAGDPVALLRAGQAFGAPLHAYQYRQPPETRRQSYLALASYSVLMTALKPPQTGKGWIVRLLNPTTQPAEASLAPYRRLVAARLVTLAEEAQSDIVIDQGTLTVKLDPYKIVTLHLEFE